MILLRTTDPVGLPLKYFCDIFHWIDQDNLVVLEITFCSLLSSVSAGIQLKLMVILRKGTFLLLLFVNESASVFSAVNMSHFPV